MRKKLVFAIFSVIVILSIAVSPVAAITGNWVEDFEHPYVGLIVFYDENDVFLGRCSGSLLDPYNFLTAGHCVVGADRAIIYFQQDAGVNYDPATELDPVTGYPEFCAAGTLGVVCATSDEIYNYGFPQPLPNRHDVALVILDQPINLSEYGQLPEAGFLDELATERGIQNVTFTASGYGLTYKNQLQNGKPNISFRERLMALSTLVNLDSALFNAGFNVQTSGNGAGKGGTCNGDSGGPIFHGGFESNLIVAVTSFGLNALCRGTDFSYRIDQADVLQWLEEHMYTP
ncbi:MAG TPA: trypsin-like serine protease [Anaerolineales bacterium]|nr:trypsin-like serine protease [Anaerolineales bacterium]